MKTWKHILGVVVACSLFGIARMCDRGSLFTTKDGDGSVRLVKNEIVVTLVPLSEYPVSNNSSDLILQWYDVMLDLIRHRPAFAPPVITKALAYTSITLYESIVAGMPAYQSLAKTLHIPTLPTVDSTADYNWLICANAAMAFAARHYYGPLTKQELERVSALEALLRRQYATIDVAVLNSSSAYGVRVASSIFEWSQSDGAASGRLQVTQACQRRPVVPGMWEPTYYASTWLPNWGDNRYFFPTAAGMCKELPPLLYIDNAQSRLSRPIVEVYDAFNKLITERANIAMFGPDPTSISTPAERLFKLLCKIIANEQVKMDDAVVTFAKLGIALNDAMIACWSIKRRYNFISTINDDTQKHIFNDWRPFIKPNFPRYPFEYSAEVGAMAEILRAQFDEHYAFIEILNDTLGHTLRHFVSFDACTNETEISQLNGGISSANNDGMAQGIKIGALVNAMPWRKSQPWISTNK